MLGAGPPEDDRDADAVGHAVVSFGLLIAGGAGRRRRREPGQLRQLLRPGLPGPLRPLRRLAPQRLRADGPLVQRHHDLPALIVVRHPDGQTHFVVVWSRVGPWVQVMDPGLGRRWMHADRFLADLYLHSMALPAAVVPVLVGTAAASLPDAGPGHGIVAWRAVAAMVPAGRLR